MYSLGSWWGGRYIFSIPFFVFPVESLVYPLYTLGLGPFIVNIFVQFAYQKKKKKDHKRRQNSNLVNTRRIHSPPPPLKTTHKTTPTSHTPDPIMNSAIVKGPSNIDNLVSDQRRKTKEVLSLCTYDDTTSLKAISSRVFHNVKSKHNSPAHQTFSTNQKTSLTQKSVPNQIRVHSHNTKKIEKYLPQQHCLCTVEEKVAHRLLTLLTLITFVARAKLLP